MELLIIFILTLLNGFFALSEIALVSVKKARIDHLAAQGNKSAKAIQKLLLNPENFLSSVQVGITLIGVIAGAYGGAALTDDMVGLLSGWGFPVKYVETISLVIVIGEEHITRREDGSHLINGRATILEINQFFSREVIEENIGQYATISGFMIYHLKSMPHAGDIVRYENLKFEVVDMDGVRIDKVAVTELDLA